METLIIEVEARTQGGKGAARRVRRAGKLPAVFYGPASAAKPIAVDARDFEKRLAHLEGSHLIELRSSLPDLDQKKVLLRDIQFDPVLGVPVHADFLEVALDREIEVQVPLHFEGKAVGVTLGGILQPIVRELTVACLPTHIPEFIAVDVSNLGIHDAVHITQLTLPAGAKVVSKDDRAVVTVVPPTVEAKPTGADAAAEGGEAATAAAEGGDAAKKGDAKKPEEKK